MEDGVSSIWPIRNGVTQSVPSGFSHTMIACALDHVLKAFLSAAMGNKGLLCSILRNPFMLVHLVNKDWPDPNHGGLALSHDTVSQSASWSLTLSSLSAEYQTSFLGPSKYVAQSYKYESRLEESGRLQQPTFYPCTIDDPIKFSRTFTHSSWNDTLTCA